MPNYSYEVTVIFDDEPEASKFWRQCEARFGDRLVTAFRRFDDDAPPDTPPEPVPGVTP